MRVKAVDDKFSEKQMKKIKMHFYSVQRVLMSQQFIECLRTVRKYSALVFG